MSWTLIEHQALTSSAASVTLGSGGTIPQTYKTLKLLVSARTDSSISVSGHAIYLRPNASSANGTIRWISGSGTAASSGTDTAIYVLGDPSNYTANTFGNSEATIPNYSGNANKPISVDNVYENNATAAEQNLAAALWSNTAAITSLALVPLVGNFVSGSTFTLYGLA